METLGLGLELDSGCVKGGVRVRVRVRGVHGVVIGLGLGLDSGGCDGAHGDVPGRAVHGDVRVRVRLGGCGAHGDVLRRDLGHP